MIVFYLFRVKYVKILLVINNCYFVLLYPWFLFSKYFRGWRIEANNEWMKLHYMYYICMSVQVAHPYVCQSVYCSSAKPSMWKRFLFVSEKKTYFLSKCLKEVWGLVEFEFQRFWERYDILYVTSVERKKKLSPQRESNPWPVYDHVWKDMGSIPVGELPTLVTYRISHPSYFFSELRIHHLSIFYYCLYLQNGFCSVWNDFQLIRLTH